MLEKVTGLIVHTTNYGETSLVIQLFTKEHGLIGVMGKGVKSLKSRLRPFVMPFTYGYFYIYYKEGKLSTLKDVDVIDALLLIHQDITLIAYLNYIAELSVQVYKESESSSIFPMMMTGILKLNDGLDPAVITNILEVKYLPFLGVGINLDECVSCGAKTGIVTIDGDKGGLICKNCYQNERIVKPKTIQLLRMYFYVDLKSISKLDIKSENTLEINQFLMTYYSRYTGMYLQSKDFLKKVGQIEKG